MDMIDNWLAYAVSPLTLYLKFCVRTLSLMPLKSIMTFSASQNLSLLVQRREEVGLTDIKFL